MTVTPPGGVDRHICPIISNIDVRIFAKKGLRHQNIVFPGQYNHFRLPRINFDEKNPIQKFLSSIFDNIFDVFRPIYPIISKIDAGIFAKKGPRHQNIIFPDNIVTFDSFKSIFDEKKQCKSFIIDF